MAHPGAAFPARTLGAGAAYTGIQAVARLNPDKGVDAYAAISRLGRSGHRLYVSHDHIGLRRGVLLLRGAAAQISKGYPGLRRRGHDGGLRVEPAAAGHRPGPGGGEGPRLAARGGGHAAGGGVPGGAG